MPDREKVIKALEKCAKGPLRRNADKYVVTLDIRFVNSILELLKEQEPKLVRIDEDSVYCPSGGNELFTYPRQKFCDECGQAVKWE